MKKLILKPGFETIFALSIIAIIGLPSLVFGQNKKEVTETKSFEVNINNGDTVINGKNIKDLKGKERDEALSSLNQHTGTINISGRPGTSKKYRLSLQRRRDTTGKTYAQDVSIPFGFFPSETFAFVNGDSVAKNLNIERINRMFTFDYGDGLPPGVKPIRNTMRFRLNDGEFNNRNTQTFNYESTDSEGISTHINYRVSDASTEKLKNIAAAEKAELAIRDINLNPEFSTGKTNLSFTLPAKTTAEIQFKDSQGKVLWSDKTTTGSFSKLFSLGLNGAYYLQVKQGGSIALKRIVKED